MMAKSLKQSESDTDVALTFASGFSRDVHKNAKKQEDIVQHEGLHQSYRDDDDFRKLITAAKRGKRSRVKKLCQNSCNVNATDQDGKTALIHAAENGHKDIVALLLGYRSDINAVDKNGNSALMYATMLGHREVVKWLCKDSADVEMKAQDGYTALVIASCLGHADIVRSLCEHGANTNVRDHKRKSPLSYATSNGHSKVVSILRHHGADVNVQDEELNQAEDYLGLPLYGAAEEELDRYLYAMSSEYRSPDSSPSQPSRELAKWSRVRIRNEAQTENEQVPSATPSRRLAWPPTIPPRPSSTPPHQPQLSLPSSIPDIVANGTEEKTSVKQIYQSDDNEGETSAQPIQISDDNKEETSVKLIQWGPCKPDFGNSSYC